MRVRAVQYEHKIEKRSAILDAAEQLLAADPERSSTVQELAEATGIAKGTLYLYFPSNKEVLLAVHQRHSEQFFDAFDAHLNSNTPVSVDSVLRIARQHVIERPLYLPLCTRVNAMMDKELPPEAVYRFKRQVADRLQQSGALLERRLPSIGTNQGAMLLMRCYSVIIGMWMLLHPIAHLHTEYDKHGFDFFKRDFSAEAEVGLRALWAGHILQQEQTT